MDDWKEVSRLLGGWATHVSGGRRTLRPVALAGLWLFVAALVAPLVLWSLVDHWAHGSRWR